MIDFEYFTYEKFEFFQFNIIANKLTSNTSLYQELPTTGAANVTAWT